MSDQSCEVDNEYRGLCSERTQELLSHQENCVRPLYSQKYSILRTTLLLIGSMCGGRTPEIMSDENESLIPIEFIENYEMHGVTIALVPPLENTKHRYPWICSLI